MRPFSTLGWYMHEAVGALHIDETTNPVMQAWMVDAEQSEPMKEGARGGGKAQAMRLALGQSNATHEKRAEGVIYVDR
jgi:hypothetical protein